MKVADLLILVVMLRDRQISDCEVAPNRLAEGSLRGPKVAKPTYTRHAREQMQLRGISEMEVERALSEFHTRYADRVGNPIVIAHVGSRRIKVVYAKNSDPPRVITAAD